MPFSGKFVVNIQNFDAAVLTVKVKCGTYQILPLSVQRVAGARPRTISGHLSENNTGSPPASSPAGNEKVVYAVCYSDFVKFLVISRNYLHLLTVITRNN